MFFSVLADEFDSHHVEQLPLCIRFVDDDNDIRDEFLEFGQSKRTDGKSIAEEIYYSLKKWFSMLIIARTKGMTTLQIYHLKL